MTLDPFTVLGLASNILQFLSFTGKVIKGTQAISSSPSGSSEDNTYLRNRSVDVSCLIDGFLDPQNGCSHDLRDVLQDCKGIVQDLLHLLDSLKVKGPKTKWKSFVIALKEIWSQSRIEDFSAKLQELQVRINTHVDLQMKKEIASISDALRRLEVNSSQLELKCHDALQCLEKTVVSAIADFAPGTSSKDLEDPPTQKRPARFDDLPIIDWKDTEGFSRGLPNFEATISGAKMRITDIMKHQALLGSLYFDTITTRLDIIPAAHKDTFTWIFKGRTADGSCQIRFVEWLRAQNGHFWIQGKPGSGKSTLMKFIAHHPETHHCLKSWAKDKPLVVAHFFFWNSGTSLQKTQEGLLRSLLFEILSQAPELAPQACESLAPSRKISLFSNLWNPHSGVFRDDKWSLEELMSIYGSIMGKETSSKFCFIIDGLDEYHSQDNRTHQDLINTLRALAMSPDVKLCLSSRPWPQFKDAFGRDPEVVLTLEDLTRHDIRQYVSDKFHENDQYQKLTTMDEKYSELVEDVVRKAQGVFLWVFLVVRDLLEGLTYNDSIKTMRSRLESLPEDLEGFFHHMLKPIPRTYREQAACAFRVALSMSHPLLLMTYACLDDVEENDALSHHPHAPYSRNEVLLKKDIMQRRIHARSRGLMEISRSPDPEVFFQHRVDFIHRTVRDFLQQSPDLQVTISQTPEDQRRTWILLCHSSILMLKRAPSAAANEQRHSKFSTILEDLCVFFGEASKYPKNFQTVNELVNASINPICRASNMARRSVRKELLMGLSKYGLAQKSENLDSKHINLRFEEVVTTNPDPDPRKHSLDTETADDIMGKRRRMEAPAHKGVSNEAKI